MATLLSGKLALFVDAIEICSFVRQAATFVTVNRASIECVTGEAPPAAAAAVTMIHFPEKQKNIHIIYAFVGLLCYVHRPALLCVQASFAVYTGLF